MGTSLRLGTLQDVEEGTSFGKEREEGPTQSLPGPEGGVQGSGRKQDEEGDEMEGTKPGGGEEVGEEEWKTYQIVEVLAAGDGRLETNQTLAGAGRQLFRTDLRYFIYVNVPM